LTPSPSVYNHMVMNEAREAQLNRAFGALADPTRRAIVARLAQSDAAVLELAAPFAMSQPAVSKHLKVLESAGLISRHRDAQRRTCHLEAEQLKHLSDWVGDYRRFWEQSFARLDSYLLDVQKDASHEWTS
jgi:DNA-binding transcriptional ArsR family regulator